MSKPIPPPSNLLQGIAQLVADQRFSELAALEKRPNLFRAVRRTYTETWHSAFLGWLLHPKGSHGLGSFPLQQFLTGLVASDRVLPPDDYDGDRFCTPNDVCTLSSTLDLDTLVVCPNEENPQEHLMTGAEGKTGSGGKDRIDVWCAPPKPEPDKAGGGSQKPGLQFYMAIEMKVEAPLGRDQAKRYHTYVQQRVQADRDQETDAKGLLVFLAPSEATKASAMETTQSPHFYCIDYQMLHDQVLVPCLGHSDLTPDMRPLIEHYVRNLRTARKDNTGKRMQRLAVTHREQALCRELCEDYGPNLCQLGRALTARTQQESMTEDQRAALKIYEHPRNEKAFNLLREIIHHFETSGSEILPEPTPALTRGFTTQNRAKYAFDGETHRYQRRVMLAVVKHWASKNQPTFAELQLAFPDELLGSWKSHGLIRTLEYARGVPGKTKRHFQNNEDIIVTADSVEATISSQWDYNNIPRFVEHAKTEHGLVLERIEP